MAWKSIEINNIMTNQFDLIMFISIFTNVQTNNKFGFSKLGLAF